MKTDSSLLLIGGGGHCTSCIDVINSVGGLEIFGILDDQKTENSTVFGVPVLGGDEKLVNLKGKNLSFLITFGGIKSTASRASQYSHLVALAFNPARIFSGHAVISNNSSVDVGTIVMHKAVLNSGSTVGKNCIINTGAIIEHDVVVGDHTHVATGVILNGGCRVGPKTFLGSGAVVLPGVQIAGGSIIGAGSVVCADISEPGTYVGTPAKLLQTN